MTTHTSSGALLVALLFLLGGCGGGDLLPAADADGPAPSLAASDPTPTPSPADVRTVEVRHLPDAGSYEIRLEDDRLDVAFRIPDTCEGVPYPEMPHDCLGSNARSPFGPQVLHWYSEGHDLGTGERQPPHCTDFTSMEEAPRVFVRIAVHPRFPLALDVSWEGNDATCSYRAAGSFSIDTAGYTENPTGVWWHAETPAP